MTLVDDRGRVGGRVNLIDAFVAIVILVLIPVAYAAYLLFRTPVPKLSSISPTRLYQGHNLKIEIEGTNLRPFMRVAFNRQIGKSFLIGSTKFALVDLPDLPPGTYDVVLYDYMQEVDRLPKALTIVTNTTDVELEVAGSFKLLPDSIARGLKTGDKFPPDENAIAKVMTVGASAPGELRLKAGEETVSVPLPDQREVPATLRLKCYTSRSQDGSQRCMVPGPDEPSVVAPGALLPLSLPPGWISFQIDSVRPPTIPPVVPARVRFVVAPELVAKIKAGDRDTGTKAFGHGATLTVLGTSRSLTPAEASGRLFPVGPLYALDATVEVPANVGIDGWTYKDRPLKAGAPFTFETDQYILQGEVINVSPPSSATSR
jgi:hypothetical protein